MVTIAPPSDARTPLAGSPVSTNDDLPTGLTSDEARRRLQRFGPNAMPDTALHPLRMAMIAGNFLAMSLTTDNVRPSPMPNSWRIGRLTMAGIVMAACLLAFCSAVLLVGRFELKLGIDVLQTLAFIALVFGNQAIIYAIRQRRHLWGSRPSLWLAVSSAADILIAAILSIQRIAMAPLAGWLVANTLAVAAGFAVIADLVKVPTFRLLGIT